jgi:hypothetical protein
MPNTVPARWRTLFAWARNRVCATDQSEVDGRAPATLCRGYPLAEFAERFPKAMARATEFFERQYTFAANLHDPNLNGAGGRHMLSILDEPFMRRVLTRMLDEERFLSPYGIRSLSKWHEKNPFVCSMQGHEFRVAYEPAESRSFMFGGDPTECGAAKSDGAERRGLRGLSCCRSFPLPLILPRRLSLLNQRGLLRRITHNVAQMTK